MSGELFGAVSALKTALESVSGVDLVETEPLRAEDWRDQFLNGAGDRDKAFHIEVGDALEVKAADTDLHVREVRPIKISCLHTRHQITLEDYLTLRESIVLELTDQANLTLGGYALDVNYAGPDPVEVHDDHYMEWAENINVEIRWERSNSL
jgi:hypothetical protein